MIKGRDIVVIGGDFGRHPSSFEHLMRRFVGGNRLIWVETIGLRRPRLSFFDLSRAVNKVGRLLTATGDRQARTEQLEEFSVIAPKMLPFHDVGWVHRYNHRALISGLNFEISRRGFRHFALLTSMPLSAGIGKAVGAAFTVYYCMDDWKNWPGLLKDALPVWERELIASSALVVATSEELRQTKAAFERPTVLLPHGVDVEHFARARRFSQAPLRRLTYFGLFDARTDQNLLLRVARERPAVEIEVIGPVQVDAATLKAAPNIRFRGPVPYQQLPEALVAADILLLPYRLDALSKSINPLKVRECLATGKPVVTMALAELAGFPGLFQAKTADAFVRHCLDLIDGKTTYRPPEDLGPWLAASSWERRADELAAHLGPLFAGHGS